MFRFLAVTAAASVRTPVLARLIRGLGPLMLASAFMSGCASTGGMRNQPIDVGTSRTYLAPLDRVLSATRAAMVGTGLDFVEANQVDPKTWMLIAKKGASVWTWGEKVRIVVQETERNHVAVRILTKRAITVNITAKGDYSQALFSQIELELKLPGAVSSR